jgi:hypothetical protein
LEPTFAPLIKTKGNYAIKVTNHRSDLSGEGKDKRPFKIRILAVIYSIFRMYYACFVFYFFPLLILVVPYMADSV